MMIASIALFSPLLSFILASLLKQRVSDKIIQLITCCCMALAAAASFSLLYEYRFITKPVVMILWNWFDVGTLNVSFGLLLDSISCVMFVVVNFISFLIHVYSVGYMSHDSSIPRFMGYLSFFTFCMLVLIAAPNLVQLFLGWEGVGLASYLLIGFWYKKPTANYAAIKAFVTNRVGDAGLILGIAAIYYCTSQLDLVPALKILPTLAKKAQFISILGYDIDALTFIGCALFIGVMGKSAQFGLHTWLPDAMEGPTPVSALIHAATMVTAGVYLLIRFESIYALIPHVQMFIMIIGALTCFFAATIGLVQDDIKRIIAYSTCSQLGYMVFATGVGAPKAAFFHLVTHAFFKALLFLGAGSVIHAVSDEQNINKMGGLCRFIPFTYIMMWVGSLALAGVPFFSGYYSKDSILVAAYLNPTDMARLVFWVGLVVAGLTGLYSCRLLVKVFHGNINMDDHVVAHIHESPWVMRLPLVFLAIGAIFLGYFTHDYFMGVPHHDDVPTWVLQAPILVGFFGLGLAFVFFHLYPAIPFYAAHIFKWPYLFFVNKWYIDDLYNKVFIQTSLIFGRFSWKIIDGNTIDRWGPNGFSSLTLSLSRLCSKMQTGSLNHYAFVLVLGVTMIGLYFTYKAFA